MKTAEEKKEYARRYYEANKERLLALQRSYYRSNREKQIEWQKAYYRNNRAQVLQKDREYVEANRETISTRRRASYVANRERLLAEKRTYYAANRKEIREYQQVYQKTTEGRVAFTNSRHRRRARKTGGDVSTVDLKKILAVKKCHICGKRFTKANPAVLDHVIPLAGGGPHVLSNLAAAHAKCNAEKWVHQINPKTGQRLLV